MNDINIYSSIIFFNNMIKIVSIPNIGVVFACFYGDKIQQSNIS